ncbi:MAG: hypothetical protein VXW57_03250, partial [Pseudomonadota bacterium]|nr:hypothetical protein [Pseudomonadota bacterium]
RRELREEDLKVQNATLRQGQAGMSLIDADSNLLKRRLLDLVISDCRSQDRPAAISFIQIVDFEAYGALHGEEKATRLTQRLARLLQEIPAALDILMVANGPGSFMLIHPGAPHSADLEAWNRKAREAVEQADIPHGNSIQSDRVTLWTEAAWAEPRNLALTADTIIDTTKQVLLERQ